jgi:hypothetical protein
LAIYAATLRFPNEEPQWHDESDSGDARAPLTQILPWDAEKLRIANNELQRLVQIAAGSASELDYELLLAKDLRYSPNPTIRESQTIFRRSETG